MSFPNAGMIHRHPGILIAILAFLVSFKPWPLFAQNIATPEYQIKAAFLYNFAMFVDWPEAAFVKGNAPFVICVLGTHFFENSLELLSKGKTLKKKSVIVRQISDVRDMEGCHILFISASEKLLLPEILAVTKKRPVLTVSDLDGFYKAGGVINFISLEGKVRFDINQKAAQAAGLKISSQLLKLAHDIIE
jgi:hypothetical protein